MVLPSRVRLAMFIPKGLSKYLMSSLLIWLRINFSSSAFRTPLAADLALRLIWIWDGMLPPSVLSLIIPTIAFPKPKEIRTPIKPMEVAVAIKRLRHLRSIKLFNDNLSLFLRVNPLFFDCFNDFTILHFNDNIRIIRDLRVMGYDNHSFACLS